MQLHISNVVQPLINYYWTHNFWLELEHIIFSTEQLWSFPASCIYKVHKRFQDRNTCDIIWYIIIIPTS